MAKEWQTVSAEEKKICDEIAAQNKADYEEAMKAYQAQLHAGVAAQAVAADGGEEVRSRRASRAHSLPRVLIFACCHAGWPVSFYAASAWSRAHCTTRRPHVQQTLDKQPLLVPSAAPRHPPKEPLLLAPPYDRSYDVSSPPRAPSRPVLRARTCTRPVLRTPRASRQRHGRIGGRCGRPRRVG